MKIDAYAHILPARYFGRVDAILSSGQVSERIRGYHPWFREDPTLFNLDARAEVVSCRGTGNPTCLLNVAMVNGLGPERRES